MDGWMDGQMDGWAVKGAKISDYLYFSSINRENEGHDEGGDPLGSRRCIIWLA